MPTLKPHSKPSAYAKIDGRTWQGRLVEETRRDLTKHVGATPSAIQRHMIDRACMLTLHVAQLDKRAAEGKHFTEYDSRVYLAWSNSLSRLLALLGGHCAAEDAAAPDLATYLASKAPAGREAAAA